MMSAYPKHDIRNVVCLDGIWSFEFLGAVDPIKVKPSKVVCNGTMPVPMAFDATTAYAGKRGTAVYRTTLRVPAQTDAFVHFAGAGLWSSIWIDGKKISEIGRAHV